MWIGVLLVGEEGRRLGRVEAISQEEFLGKRVRKGPNPVTSTVTGFSPCSLGGCGAAYDGAMDRSGFIGVRIRSRRSTGTRGYKLLR